MKPVRFDAAESYEPDEGWRRVALAGSEQFSFEWFEKPPGHSSPIHDHENEQVCLVLQGELTVYVDEGDPGSEPGGGTARTLEAYDSVLFESWEPHRVENASEERAVGLDVFAPGRSFDFWTDRTDESDSTPDEP